MSWALIAMNTGLPPEVFVTKEQLVFYLRVCADLADKPGDQVAYVRVPELRQTVELLTSSAEPELPSYICVRHGAFKEPPCPMCAANL